MDARPTPIACAIALCAYASAMGAASAMAQLGSSYGAGPVLAFDSEHGAWLGWEAGLGAVGPLLHLAVGGSYRLSSGDSQPRMLHHAVLEPWFIVGGSLGLGLADAQPELVYGLWEGIPFPIEGELSGGDNSDDIHPEAWVVTFAFGFRGFITDGDFSLFYFTPKLWRFRTIELNS